MKLNILYKRKLMEWLDMRCELRRTCRIQDRIQDQVFMKTEALQSPPGTAVSIKNSDENIMERKWRNSIIRRMIPPVILALTLIWASVSVLVRV